MPIVTASETLAGTRERSRHYVTSPDIRQRWDDRVVANGWEHDGINGGIEYLKRYGRNMGFDKAAALASKAEQEHAPEFAAVFWIVAHDVSAPAKFLGTGLRYRDVAFAALQRQLPRISGTTVNAQPVQQVVQELSELLNALGLQTLSNQVRSHLIDEIKKIVRKNLPVVAHA